MAVKVVMAPTQIIGDNPTVNEGLGLTVIKYVPIQPVEEVYVIVAVPAEIAVNKPEEFILATEVFDDDHAFPEAGG